MKKTIFAVLVLILAGPVMAANVVITVVDDGNGMASINYTSDVNVRAFALNVEVTAGVNIVDVNQYFEGDCNATSKGFGIFLDQINGIDINDAGVVQEWGSPVADACSPGATGSGFGTNKVVLGMGALYEDGHQPAFSGTLCKFRVEGMCTVSVTEEETYRGGVVLEDGNGTDPDLTGATNIPLFECYGKADYAQWVKAGRPACWCNEFQCKGDADGLFEGKDTYGKRQWVVLADLNILTAGWQQYDGPNGEVGSWICADFDHLFEGKDANTKRQWVVLADLNILSGGWQRYDNDPYFTTNPCFP